MKRKSVALILLFSVAINVLSTNLVQAVDLSVEKSTSDNELKDDKKDSNTSNENSENNKSEAINVLPKEDEKKESNIEENKANQKYDSTGIKKEEIIFKKSELKNLQDISIVSKTSIKKEEAKKWAENKGATDEFIKLADLYWEYYPKHGFVNPAVAYAQAAKETGYGKFGGVVDATYHNPCGLKTKEGGENDDPNAHQRFNNWSEGVQAHLDHLALYAAAEGYPREKTFDPRHFPSIKDKNATTVAKLGGAWAPSEQYGWEIIKIYDDIEKFSNEHNKPNSNKLTWEEKDGKHYYYDENGQITKGWKVIDGYWYYFNENGEMQVNFVNLDNGTFYFANDGKMRVGWQIINGYWYYFRDNGAMQTGVVDIEGRTFYLGENGIMRTGFHVVDGQGYHFAENGEAESGWKNIEGNKHYFGDDKVMKIGWTVIDGYWFYFAQDGKMQKDFIKIDDKIFYLGMDGIMRTGWQVINGYWYYFENNGEMKTGWQVIDGHWYYMDGNGLMKTGWQEIDNQYFYLGDNGAMKTGWQVIDGYWYYLADNGAMQKGLIKIEGREFYLNEVGIMQIGWHKVKDNWHYFYNNGEMAKNTTIDGYYIDENGIRREKKLIVVDPGHNYGGDDGSYATHNGVKYSETELNMQVAMRLQEKLEKLGYTVVMTRTPFERPTDDLYTSITKRVDLANSLNANAFISIHHDSGASLAHGVTTFYSSYKPGLDNEGIVPGKDPNGYDWYEFEMDTSPTQQAIKGKEMAKAIVDDLSKAGNYANRKEHDRGLGVTRRTNMPSVLVECGFISNSEEAKKCADPVQQDKVANSIANSIRKMF